MVMDKYPIIKLHPDLQVLLEQPNSLDDIARFALKKEMGSSLFRQLCNYHLNSYSEIPNHILQKEDRG